uniref:Glycoside hydrolase family 5 domain-containing protein n=1 Tax=Haptolina ericina TaxID=156174 RepID=A0A7S3FJY2_9EUKA
MSIPAPAIADYVCDGMLRSPEVVHHRHANALTPKMRGVNLGGWLLLQPWITPSLFYQFEDQPPDRTAMDMYNFCRVLGPIEGNRQLREHWTAWVTERELERLVEQGINAIRVPVGDWMWEPYGPYIGCTEGSLHQLQRVLRISDRIGLRVLIDLHGVRRSQNGFDNSGHAVNISWFADGQHFSHWPYRSAGWQGEFDPVTLTYSHISWDNIRNTVELLQQIAFTLRGFESVVGIEALNEPWQFTPIDVLKAFYWDSYWAVRAAAPSWLFVIHDSFRLDEWRDFMKGCPAVALDTHVYQAWFDIRSQQSFLEDACSWRQHLRSLQRAILPVLVGEWSLATDNCMMWLNGFHDNAPGYPKVECGVQPCPQPYVSGIPGPPQGLAPGPHGTGASAPSNGMCPVSKSWENEQSIEADLAAHKISAFDEAAGWFYWNFKSELEGRWSWQTAWDRGWLPLNLTKPSPQLLNICFTGDTDDEWTGSNSDLGLPWYNALPSAHTSSPVVLLMGIGLGTLIGVAALLKVVLSLLVRGGARQQDSLQLPPRLLHLARKSQGRKPGGLGVLGLKQRVSSRSLAQLAFPLMNPQHAIEEADEEADSLHLGSHPGSVSSDLYDAATPPGTPPVSPGLCQHLAPGRANRR